MPTINIIIDSNYLFSIENVDIIIVNKHREEIQELYLEYILKFQTKNEIKEKIIKLLNKDTRKEKLKKLNF
jgi:hypothetical protein